MSDATEKRDMKRAILAGAWGGLALAIGLYELALAGAVALGWASLGRAAQATGALALGVTWLRCEWRSISDAWHSARGRRRWTTWIGDVKITSDPLTRAEWDAMRARWIR